MSKEDVSVPLNQFNPSTNNAYMEETARKTKKKSYSCIVKIILIVLFTILIILLIATLITVLLRPCVKETANTVNSTPLPKEEKILNPYWNDYLLPQFIAKYPHYDLKFQILTDLFTNKSHSNFSFFGHAKINIILKNSTKFIVLHINEIKIINCSIYEKSQTNNSKILKRIKDEIIHVKHNYWIIVFDDELIAKHQYEIDIIYRGLIINDQDGLIKTIYNDLKTDKQHLVIYSKLEPVGARRMFPCFDQPNIKATYSMSIIHEKRYQSLSNMPESRSQTIGVEQFIATDKNVSNVSSAILTEFEPSKVPMSTYLVGLVLVENYANISQRRNSDSLVRVWYPNNDKGSSEEALAYAVKIETFFENYFNVISPLPKTDHIYIPNFLSGAMENWGLITYRERYLLVPENSSQHFSRTSLKTIAHELAHIWFGNWITANWWSEIWINEGFATYFASYVYFLNLNLTEERREEMVAYERRSVLDSDAVSSAKPVIHYAEYPNDCKAMFNAFTYTKGQNIITWIESIMGRNNFQMGMTKFLKKYKRNNPTTQNLFTILDDVGYDRTKFKLNLTKFFEPWLYFPGCPFLFVSYDTENSVVNINQYSSLSDKRSANESRHWPVYSSFITNDSIKTASTFFLYNTSLKLELKNDDFFVLNNDGKAYVRVNYSSFLWNRIIKKLNSSTPSIEPISRIVIYDDAFYFSQENKFNLSITKNLMDTLSKEENIIPWMTFHNRIMTKIFDFFRNDILFLKWKDYVKDLSKGMLEKAFQIKEYDRLNLFDEIHQREIIIINCDIENEKAINWISERFSNWIKDPWNVTIPKHMAKEILHYGLKFNDKYEYWNKIWNMMVNRDETVKIDWSTLAVGLSGTRRPYLIEKLLNSYLQPKSHKTDTEKFNDIMNLIGWLLKSHSGSITVKKWIYRNQNATFVDSYFSRIVTNIASATYDIHDYMVPLLKSRGTLGKQKIIENNNWRENVGKVLIKML